MKKISLILISLFTSLNLWSAHIVGGDIYYDYLGNNNYRITIVLFRDCASTGAEFDDQMSVGVFNSSNILVQEVSIPFPGSVVLPVILNNPCVTPPSNICTERAIYTKIISLPASPGGYTVSYQRCCRGPNVTNLNSPEDTGLTLTTHITGTNLNALINSSPRFTNYPPLVICNNDILNFDHSATDPDGDVLEYELIIPFAGADVSDPMPQPPPSPPYAQVNFLGGFSPINPLGPGATISINSTTGQLIADPEMLGLFVVGIRVKEYRNGVLIGQSDRDFLFKVVNCVIQLQAEVVPQTEGSTFISFCQGLQINFENNSFGGTNYSWDFGVPGTSNDVSSEFEPVFTFPAPGEYEVTLIVNPGWPCTDTSTQNFLVQNGIDISFTTVDSICITGNSFDFIGEYNGPPNPNFTWDFGQNANLQTANTLDVDGVVFNQSGYIPVTLSVETGLCVGTFTDLVFLYDEAQINFGVDPELKCAPYEAFFLDSSTSYAPLIYNWSFGDGATSTEANPSHVYQTPGTYDVSLSIQSTEGCVNSLSLDKPNLIQVFPGPTADFVISPNEQTVFNPNFYVSDESFDSDIIFYVYNDSLLTFDRNPSFTFVESGNHRVTQIVENEFGCRDTTFKIVSVIPQTTVFIPNTFTPDGNKFNNLLIPVIFDVLNYEFWIYNRWGQEIFYSDELREGWDGTYKGEICQDGVYTYKLKFADIQTNETEIISGHFNLLR